MRDLSHAEAFAQAHQVVDDIVKNQRSIGARFLGPIGDQEESALIHLSNWRVRNDVRIDGMIWARAAIDRKFSGKMERP
jgi:hypothetical protein